MAEIVPLPVPQGSPEPRVRVIGSEASIPAPF